MNHPPRLLPSDVAHATVLVGALLAPVVLGAMAAGPLRTAFGDPWWWVGLVVLAQGLLLVALGIGRRLDAMGRRRQRAPSQRLEATGRWLPRVHDLHRLLKLTTRLLVRCLGASHATIYLEESPTARYQLTASDGAHHPRTIPQIDASSPLIRWLVEHRTPLSLAACPEHNGHGSGPKADPYHRLRFVLENLQAVLIVPSFRGRRLVGFLVLGARPGRSQPYRDAEVTALQHLAEECAIALENAHRDEALQATTRKLKTTTDRLVQQERMVTAGRFAMGLAHEIKNPLAAIKTFTEYLPERHEDPAFRDEFSRVVGKEVDRINRIVQSLSDFAKPLPLRVETVDVQRLLHDTVILLSNDCLKRDVTVHEALEPDPIVLPADPHQLRQAILNFCLNALDAMPHGGTLTVGCALRDGEAILTIADTGCGIPQEQLAHLFDPFFTTKDTGMGLGLAVVKQIVDQHVGTIDVESEVGRGTTFAIRLPLAVRLGPRPTFQPSADGHPEDSASPGSLSGLELLVVDDDPRIGAMIQGCAEAWGCQVRVVGSGEEALQAVSQKPPQLVLLDLALEEMDGFEVLRRLKLAYPALRVVVITGSEDALVDQHVRTLGALVCLHKPLDMAHLKHRLIELSQ